MALPIDAAVLNFWCSCYSAKEALILVIIQWWAGSSSSLEDELLVVLMESLLLPFILLQREVCLLLCLSIVDAFGASQQKGRNR
jgi:hypothetical protein